MKKRSKLFVKLAIGLVAIACIFITCQNQDESITPGIDDLENFVLEGNKMVLGEQLENPYSVENMKKALAGLKANGRTAGNFDIETTDLYIRFLPKDSTELEALEADTTLNLYDHPMDFEIEEVGNWYHDPEIPGHLPTYQYTVVKPDFAFPDTLEYEVLAELFIPEEEVEDDTKNGRTSVDLDLLHELEDEALRITNNWEDPFEIKDNERGRYHPRGRVMVRERVGNSNRRWLPVKYVRVRARRWFTIRTDYTDSRGYYKISKRFRRKVNYSVKWRTPDVNITNWLGWATLHNGPKRKGSWNAYFDWHSKSWVRATLVNAAAEYDVQRRRTGIQNPFAEGFWKWAGHRMKIRAVFKEGSGSHWPIRKNRIKIRTKFDGGSNKETDDLYKLMFHELGHQSHWKLNRWNITFSSKLMRESFADFIEYYFTVPYYPNHSGIRRSSSSNSTSIPDRDKSEMSDGYTTVFVDLMDNDNQLSRLGGDRPNDNVTGYTFGQIQNAVKNSRKIDQVKNYLEDNYNNSTSSNLDQLIDFYDDIE